MQLIDTHAHLTTVAPIDLPQLLERARNAHVTRFICIGASDGIATVKAAHQLSRQYANIWFTVGVHPHDAKDYQSLDQVLSVLTDPKAVAVGETGLDYYRDWAPVENQRQLFRNTIAVAREVKKPLVIHCRVAAEDTIAILQAERAAEVGGVFHCYAEDAQFAEKLEAMNFLVSFTGNITFKKAEALRQAASQIPLEQIMLETDMPYMAPEPFRGKPSEPMHVYTIAQRLAEVKQVSIEEVARITTATAMRFFGLS